MARRLSAELLVNRLSPTAIMPKRATPGSSGFDICADMDGELAPGTRTLVKTGLRLAVPVGFEVQVRSRSGNALKKGVFVLNQPGTVDSDYRNEVGVILANFDPVETFTFKRGDRIAQIVVCPVIMCEAEEVQNLDQTNRTGGFGSTGIS